MKARKMPAKLLRNYRKTHGITQEQFAELCGLSPDEISLIECEKISPRFDIVYRMLEVMGINLEKILDV